MLSTGILFASLLFGSAAATTPSEPTIKKFVIGDQAPALQVDEWIKGTEVKVSTPGDIRVVAFWGSWSAPSMESIPLLSELQDRFADDGVTIIGLNTEGPKADDLKSIKAVVADLGDTLRFTIGWEAKPLSLRSYMFNSGREILPLAFIIDKEGKLAFVGLPNQLETPLARMVAKDWDAELQEQIRKTRIELMESIDFIESETQHSIEGARAGAVLEKWLMLLSKNPEMRRPLGQLHYRIMVSAGLEDKANRAGGKLVDSYIAIGQSAELNSLAWSIVDPERTIKHRDLALALRAAKAGSAMRADKNPGLLDTLARVHFLMGDFKTAKALQMKAVGFATDKAKAPLEVTLQEYKDALESK